MDEALHRIAVALERIAAALERDDDEAVLEARRDHPSYTGLEVVCGAENEGTAERIACFLPASHVHTGSNHMGRLRLDDHSTVNIQWAVSEDEG